MKKQLAAILLCVVLLVCGRLWLAPVVRDMQTRDIDYANRERFAWSYLYDFELCAKYINGNYFYYTAWCDSQLDDKPMYVLRVFEGKRSIGGDITKEHFAEDSELKVYRIVPLEKQYVVFGHNPDKKYSQYTLDLLDNNQVARQYVVDISDKEHILDVYDCDKIYIPRLEFN